MNLSYPRQSVSFGLKAKLALLTLALIFSTGFAMFLAPAEADAQGVVTLSVKANIRFGEPIVISGTGFGSGELIALWLTGPSGATFPGGYVNANANGTFENFPVGGGDTADNNIVIAGGAGKWAVTASGSKTKATVFVNFDVFKPVLLAAARNVGNSIVILVYAGAYWFPNERVNLWVTDGVGQVLGLDYTFADRQGFIPDPTKIVTAFGGTAGVYSLTARGATSGNITVTQFNATLIGG